MSPRNHNGQAKVLLLHFILDFRLPLNTSICTHRDHQRGSRSARQASVSQRLAETQMLGSAGVFHSVSPRHGLTRVPLTPSMPSLLEVQELYLEAGGGEQMVTRAGKPKSSSCSHTNSFNDRDSLESLVHLVKTSCLIHLWHRVYVKTCQELEIRSA